MVTVAGVDSTNNANSPLRLFLISFQQLARAAYGMCGSFQALSVFNPILKTR